MGSAGKLIHKVEFHKTICWYHVILAGVLLFFCFWKRIPLTICLIPAFAVLLYAVRMARKKIYAFTIGYLFGLGYFSTTLYWIAESFKCVGYGNYGYLAVACLVMYLAIYPALACGFAKLLATTKLNLMILFSVLWVFFEYIRGILFTGFPWNLIGYSALGIPYFSQISDIFGVYGVSFFLVLISVLFACRKTIQYAAILLFLICSYGYCKVNFGEYFESDKRITVSLVQPSISQVEKNDINKLKENINRHIGLSLRNHKRLKLYEGTRLVVWPEAAINTPVNPAGNILKYIASAIKESKEIIIAGCDRFDSQKELYNSAYVFSHDAKIKQVYDKRHLLPYGEYIPNFLKFWKFKKISDGITDFSSGKLPRTIKIEGTDPFDIVICYEIAFPGDVMDSKTSTWILNITNDAWFGTSDGPIQHMRMVRFRAIEEGRSIARCANNGISCIIDCNGNVVQSLGTNEIGTIDEIMPLKFENTFYSRNGNSTIFILLIIIGMFSLCMKRRDFHKYISHR